MCSGQNMDQAKIGVGMPVFQIAGKNVLFVHVPKTGGSSIESWLRQHGPEALFARNPVPGLDVVPQHFDAATLQNIMSESFIDYSFMVVRDPVKRVLSEYFYDRSHSIAETGLPFPRILGSGPSALAWQFDQWCKVHFALSRRTPTHKHGHFQPQSDFSGFAETEVFRFEDGLESIVARVAGRLGIAPPECLEHKKRGGKFAFEPFQKTLVRIERHFEADFVNFGYARPTERDF